MSRDHNFGRERRAEADSNRGPSAYQPNALPLGQTDSLSENKPRRSETLVLFCAFIVSALVRSEGIFLGHWLSVSVSFFLLLLRSLEANSFIQALLCGVLLGSDKAILFTLTLHNSVFL